MGKEWRGVIRKRFAREPMGAQKSTEVHCVLQESTGSVKVATCLRTLQRAFGQVENRRPLLSFLSITCQKAGCRGTFCTKSKDPVFRGKYQEVQRMNVQMSRRRAMIPVLT